MSNIDQITRYDILFPNQARGATADANPTSHFANGATGARFDINVSALTGTSVTFTVQGFDEAAGEWFDLIATAAITATGRKALIVDPRCTAAANAAASVPLTNRFRLKATHTSVTAVTYSAAVTYSR